MSLIRAWLPSPRTGIPGASNFSRWSKRATKTRPGRTCRAGGRQVELAPLVDPLLAARGRS